MPGILPMKVIKVGSSAQARIAQACDRCRSKKIRCDGVRPSCTQCINVGFECKTSDKLSRRAFPRGYTESLEERVRQLEAEIRELKDLLDEREEKIDVLSKCQSLSPRSKQRRFSDSPPRNDSVAGSTVATDEIIRMGTDSAISPSQDKCLTSSGSLLGAFKARVARSPKSSIIIDVAKLSITPPSNLSRARTQPFEPLDPPPRVLSDQLINIFFQQWAPLYPIFSRSGLLSSYQQFTAEDGELEDKLVLAQLYLIFAISADSSQVKLNNAAGPLNTAWRSILATESCAENLDLLRSYALAMIYCLQRADYASLSAYQGLAVGLTYRLGLDKTAYNPAPESRENAVRQGLLWTIYMLDAFAAAQLSVPALLKIDETVCLPPLSVGAPNASGAIAIAQASRILADAVAASEKAKSVHGMPGQTVSDLADRLEYWYKNLPQQLVMQFTQDKPSTNVVTSQSPILAIYFYYIKSIIYRLPLCSTEVSESVRSTATVKSAEASKRLIQLLSLLEERGLSFAMPLNKTEILVTAGISILFQSLDVADNGAMMKDHQRTLSTAHGLLTRIGAPVANEFIRIGRAIASARSLEMPTPILPRRGSDRQILSAAIASLEQRPDSTPARASSDSARSLELPAPAMHHKSANPACPAPPVRRSSFVNENFNLDFLSFGSDPNLSPKSSAKVNPAHQRPSVSVPEWERLLSNLDLGAQNLYDSIYGGSCPDSRTEQHRTPSKNINAEPLGGSLAPIVTGETPVIQLPHGWHLSYEDYSATHEPNNVPQSVLSFSDESITSGSEDFADLASPVDLLNGGESYPSIVIPQMSPLTGGVVGVDDSYDL